MSILFVFHLLREPQVVHHLNKIVLSLDGAVGMSLSQMRGERKADPKRVLGCPLQLIGIGKRYGQIFEDVLVGSPWTGTSRIINLRFSAKVYMRECVIVNTINEIIRNNSKEGGMLTRHCSCRFYICMLAFLRSEQ